MNFKSRLILPVVTIAILSGCTYTAPQIEGGQYWQRVSASDAAYIQGPKAQQMLNRDIGRCVVELRELERLGSLKNAIPLDARGKVLDPDQKKMADWDTPDHDGALLSEHSDYHDFEGCMLSNGWERTKFVPYDVAESARVNFYKAHVDYGYDPKVASKDNSTEQEKYRDMNQ
jgi:hypothetical protein